MNIYTNNSLMTIAVIFLIAASGQGWWILLLFLIWSGSTKEIREERQHRERIRTKNTKI